MTKQDDLLALLAVLIIVGLYSAIPALVQSMYGF